MRLLYHFPLSPFSRKVRILLKEKDLSFELINENFWERRKEFLELSPSGQVPVLIESDEVTLTDSIAICEFLDEVYSDKLFIGTFAKEKADIRTITNWFNYKFYNEVSRYLLEEKVYKCYKNTGEPNSDAIRAAKTNIYGHLDYIVFLLKKNKWLAGDNFSLADISAASQISVLDYIGDIPWEYNQMVKDWYALVKSRPSFRPLLTDRIIGFKPPRHYSDLDF